jgi:hypothetical protein
VKFVLVALWLAHLSSLIAGRRKVEGHGGNRKWGRPAEDDRGVPEIQIQEMIHAFSTVLSPALVNGELPKAKLLL